MSLPGFELKRLYRRAPNLSMLIRRGFAERATELEQQSRLVAWNMEEERHVLDCFELRARHGSGLNRRDRHGRRALVGLQQHRSYTQAAHPFDLALVRPLRIPGCQRVEQLVSQF